MISVENLSKSYGSQLLLDNISFKINPREHVGLVGRNGHGKTTLIRLITGEEHPDNGSIIISKHYKIGHVKQNLVFTEDTILKEGMKGLHNDESLSWKVEKILFGLGFSKEDMQRPPGEFSGGYQIRLNLAKVLVSEPDLLLLDEPTNYLDITSIRWIERFLQRWKGELLLISHDRSFMDKVVTHTIGIHRKKTQKIVGNTEKLYSRIARDEEIYEKTRLNDEKKKKEVEQFINRFRAKARLANMVQSRIKTLEKSEKRDKLEKISPFEFSFRSSPFNAKQILSADNISFSYEAEKQLIKNLNITIGAQDRICIMGKNGKGKTTLLKLLASELTFNSGEINYHPNVKKGFYEQTNVKTLVDKRTVEEEILVSHPDVDRQLARNICGAMMFEGDDALKKIKVISGGEKSRVMLGKLLVTPINLLLLDEPTNHLDMESCDSLLAALDSFKGAIVIVTHNEMFLHALAERIIIFQNNEIKVLECSYKDFLDSGGWENEEESLKFEIFSKDDKNNIKKSGKKEIRRERSEIIKERSKILKPVEQQITIIEKSIEKNEEELNQFNSAMIEASHEQDGKRIGGLSRSIHNCKSNIDELFDELEKLTIKNEENIKYFEERLNQLE